MKAKVIKTKKEHAEALERVYQLMQADHPTKSPEFEELELLVLLVAEYEEEHYPVPQPGTLTHHLGH